MAIALVLNRQRQGSLEDSAAFGHVAERFRRAGDHRRAVSLCRDGLRRFPDHVSARVTLGLALVQLGEFDQAREALQLALRRAPDNLAAIRGLAHLHDHGGEADPPMQNLWEPPAQNFIVPVEPVVPVVPVEPVVPVVPVFARDPELQHYFNALPYPPPLPVEPVSFEIEQATNDFIDFESLDEGLETLDVPPATISACPIGRSA